MNVSSYDFTKCVNCSHVCELSNNMLVVYIYVHMQIHFYQKILKLINKYKTITKHTYSRDS